MPPVTLAFAPKARRPMEGHRKHLLDDLHIQLILSIIFPLFKSFHVVNYGQLCSYSHGDIPPSFMVLYFSEQMLIPMNINLELKSAFRTKC